jgi:chaperonin cofactor prefoldin
MHNANQTQQTKPAPAPRPAPAPQPPTVASPPEAPRTPNELQALAAKRSELKQQLESVTDRREELADQLEEVDAAARPGLEARIRILDERATRLEREILQADDAIAAAVAAGVGEGPREEVIEVPPPLTEDVVPRDVLANALIAEALAFLLLGVFAYRSLMKRARERFSRGTSADSARLDQLQNAVDAIAVEVERISEGQRYVTKALGEGFQPVGSAEAREKVGVPRKGT